MTCGYQFNFLFVVELDASVFDDDEVDEEGKPRASACE